MYLTFVMDIKRTAGSFAARCGTVFGSGTPLAKILLAGVSRWLMAALSDLSELGRLLLWHLQKTRSPLEEKERVLHFCNGHATRSITFLKAIKSGSMPEHSDQSLSSEEYSALLVDVTQWLEQARRQAGRAVNALMTATYWRIGERIFEQEQRGGERVGYGERIVEQLARDLSARFGRGFSRANVFQMRQFYLAYRDRVQTSSGLLGAAGIVQTLSRQFDVPFPLCVPLCAFAHGNHVPRDYYEHEALRGGWSSGIWIARSQPRRINDCTESPVPRLLILARQPQSRRSHSRSVRPRVLEPEG